jgi:hypothetical protein
VTSQTRMAKTRDERTPIRDVTHCAGGDHSSQRSA